MGNEKKRMVESYEVTHGIPIGDKEVVLGVDEKAELPYLCAFYTSNDIFGSYTDCMVADDYVEIVELFAERVKEQCVKIREEQAKVTVPREVITAEMCLPLKNDDSLEGKVAAVRTDSIRPEYRSAEHQLVLVTGGNGARGGARGSACRNGQRNAFCRYRSRRRQKRLRTRIRIRTWRCVKWIISEPMRGLSSQQPSPWEMRSLFWA